MSLALRLLGLPHRLRRQAAAGCIVAGKEHRIQTAGPLRHLKPDRPMGPLLADRQLGAHSDHRVHRAGHPDIGQIPRAARQHPGIEVEIREGQNRLLPQRLKKGELDLIIAIPRTEEPEIVWEDFYWEKILLMGSRNLLRRVLGKEAEEIQKELDQRGDLSPLKDCPFLLGAAGDINADVGRALLRQSGVIPLVSARSENMETLLELCLREIGLCFCPDTLARRVLTPEQRREVFGFSLGDQARYLLRFGTLKQRYQPREIQDFIALCREIRPLG